MSTLVERLRELARQGFVTARDTTMREAAAELERLTAERDALRKDAGRLDFLDSVSKRSHMIGKKKWPITSDMHIGAGQCVLYIRTGVGSECEAYGIGPTVREAIDAAREHSHDV